MKKLLWVALLVIVVGGVFQWREIREREQEARGFAQLVRGASRDVAEQLDLFRGSRGVTFAEAIAAANDRIAQL